jgi:uncharacterized delta-60 repeat protein
MKIQAVLVSLIVAGALAACSTAPITPEDLGVQPTLEELSSDNESGLELAGTSNGLGTVLIRKIYDVNQNGKFDPGDQGVPDWGVRIVSVDANGNPDDAADVQVTPQGSERWRGVNLKVPFGRYKIEELTPTATRGTNLNWKVTGRASSIVNVNRSNSWRAIEFAGVCLENNVVVAFPKDFGNWKCRASFDLRPRIASFTATPNQIASGGNSNLNWKVLDYSKLEVTPNVGVVTGFTGSKNVTIQSTTNYTLKATNGFGSSSSSVTLSVGSVPSGSPDAGFGNAGQVFLSNVLPFQNPFIQVNSSIILKSGRILVAGYGFDLNDSTNQSEVHFLLLLNAQGQLETSFGNGGKVLFDEDELDGRTRFLRENNDGKLEVVGTNRNLNLVIRRFLANGAIDTAFGNQGAVRQTQNLVSDLALQPDGKILGIRRDNVRADDGTGVYRYNQDGSLDNGFANNGFLRFNPSNPDLPSNDFGDPIRRIGTLAVQSDGKIIITAGVTVGVSAGPNGPIYDADLLLARYSPSGNLDTSFGKQGSLLVDTGTRGANFLRPDGNLLALEIGALTPTILRVPEGIYLDAAFNQQIGRRNGKLYFLGGSSDIIRIAVFNAQGSRDTSFANNGVLERQSIFGNEGSSFESIAVQPDGKILIAGITLQTRQVVILRYNP